VYVSAQKHHASYRRIPAVAGCSLLQQTTWRGLCVCWARGAKTAEPIEITRSRLECGVLCPSHVVVDGGLRMVYNAHDRIRMSSIVL